MPVTLSFERRILRIDSETVGIGCSLGNELVIPNDSRIAPNHAVLRSVNGRWIVESREGGPVRIGNGRPTQFAWVNPGDVIHLTVTGPDLVFEPVSQNQVPVDQSRNVLPPGSPGSKPTPDSILSRQPEWNSTSYNGLLSSGLGQSHSPLISEKLPVSNSLSVDKGSKFLTVLIASGLVLIGLIAVGAIILTKKPSSEKNIGSIHDAEADDHSPLQPPVNSQQEPFPVYSSATPLNSKLEPQDFLVLVGLWSGNPDDRPLVVSVGWLCDRQTVVVPRHVGIEVEKFDTDSKTKRSNNQACVVQGVRLAIDKFEHPKTCSEISLIKLSEPADLTVSALSQWQRLGRAEIEKKRMKGKPITYFSYNPFPLPENVRRESGFPLNEYDPETCRQCSGVAHLEFDDKSGQHFLKSTETPNRLERGGLLFDDEQNILGMVSLDSSIVWTDSLEKALANR